ncbi:TonB-dependent receptor [Tenacibaculum maritimum]|uniref:TonB-dependent receptor n=1 Tax=Tenacibaculum maritimum TaxID=107401 RepID=UPI0012E6CC9F|nr:carboxypeptidase-like regulatory domain-containing protein [Tenacibaculum maritimum]CAA0216409.1 TonB-dependent outer membrane receptor [Tenacibaculum maritimum]
MKNFKNLLLVVLFFTTAIVFGQAKLTGIVVDEMGEPLPGANVMEKGTTNGTSTDFDGKFVLKSKSNKGAVIVSFVGYSNKQVAFSSSKVNLGKIQLEASNTLDEIVVTATSFAVDRKTPVAVSTIKASDIEAKLGTQEFPEVLKSTPGVYATKTGGGFGDSRINLRGFRSENIGVLINGVPVNDMENGAVYWSNWAGLSDVTSAMQVQRGLGASKVAVPSVGGTINIISKSTDTKKGGSISASTGNDGYQKYGMTLSTGLMDNGLAVTVSGATVSGDGYVDGTQFEGFNYFLNVAKKINDQHKLSFTAFGAKQEHGQRYNRRTIAQNRATQQGGKRFNPDWGYRNGKVQNLSFNFYHKPQLSLNHDWTISDKTFLTTAVYASFGNGGGRRNARSDGEINKFSEDSYRLGGGADQPIDFDRIVEENIDRGILGSSNILSASRNAHKWYGVLSTIKTDFTENLVFSGGIDARYYVGSHWYEVTDLLGGRYFINPNRNDNNYKEALRVGDRFNRDYDGKVLRYGGFGQLEYTEGDLSVFLATAISNTRYSKESYLNDVINLKGRKSEEVNFLGYSTKGGANYNIDGENNIFANIGYFSRAPFLTGSVFVNKQSVDLNEDAVNEKVFSAEVGYGYRSPKFALNLNLYRTSWLDKAIVANVQDQANAGEYFTANLSGLDALHQGLEVDFSYKPIDELSFTGMASLGDWTWRSDISGEIFNDVTGESLKKVIVNAKGLRVSDAAQTTFALGAKYSPEDKTSFFVDYNYAGDIYARFNITKSTDRMNAWKMPSYHLFDLGFRHGFKIGVFDATLSGKLNNIFDTEYISDAFDGDGHTAQTANVYYGAGRTFSLGLKIKF